MILIFILVTLSLGSGVFPTWHPNWSQGLIWSLALVAALLFFASVLLHELSHSLVARAFGLPVRSVTLFLFGGMAHLEDEPKTPLQEALIAGVGPATSIALGLLFILAGGLSVAASGIPVSDPIETIIALDPVTTLLLWLGPVNIFLGIFNLLPAFPLDGGRVLRAALWAGTKNLKKATRWAAGIGQAFAMLVVLAGVAMSFGVWLPFLGGGLVQGLWFIFIGWFLNSAAQSSYRAVAVRDLLEDVTVGRLMRRQLPPTVSATTPVGALVEDYLLGTGESLFLVGESPTEARAVVRASDVKKVPRGDWALTPVGAIATSIDGLPRISPDEEAYKAVQLLGRVDADALAVVTEGRVVGVLRREDVARWLEFESRAPQPEPSGRVIDAH